MTSLQENVKKTLNNYDGKIADIHINIENLNTALDSKVDKAQIEEIKISLNTKANQTDIEKIKTDHESDIETINATLDTKADKTEIESLEITEQQKADRLRYYGDANITPSDNSLFTFTLITQEIIDSANSSGSSYYDDTHLDTYMVAAVNREISGDIVIPYEYNGKKVTVINDIDKPAGWQAFGDCKNITGITLPNTITLIGPSAFKGCNFIEIIIPGSVRKISGSAFNQCGILKKVVLREGIIELGAASFYACTKLAHIEIPSTLTTVVSEGTHPTFHGCTGVKDIYYNGTKEQFDMLNVGSSLLHQATIKYNYITNTELNSINNNIANIASLDTKVSNVIDTKIPQLTEAIKNGFRIKEYILREGDTFVLKPNTVCVVSPPDKTMEIHHADGKLLASKVGIIGFMCTEVEESDGKFRAPTFYQTSGALGISSYEASYFYFQEGAYVKYTGTTGEHCRVVCNEPVGIEE